LNIEDRTNELEIDVSYYQFENKNRPRNVQRIMMDTNYIYGSIESFIYVIWKYIVSCAKFELDRNTYIKKE